ncbi:MAG: hypothetical protein Q4C12_06210 [Clostridia bacterium]|nr:hypothetical protein [Clostridia bacterium]
MRKETQYAKPELTVRQIRSRTTFASISGALQNWATEQQLGTLTDSNVGSYSLGSAPGNSVQAIDESGDQDLVE